MANALAVNTSGGVDMGTEQAKYFAISIFADLKAYVKAHKAEYEQWLIEQEAGDLNE